jgi:amidase
LWRNLQYRDRDTQMNIDEYRQLDGLALAEMARAGAIHPTELLSLALDQCRRVNPAINAVVDIFEDRARAAIDAGLPDGPFYGVPFLIKDLGIDLVGTRTTLGARIMRENPVAVRDHHLADALQRVGTVIFGRTNVPEFGINATTEPELYGATRNPWDIGRTAGGSSGGAAAAVAAGIVPAAHGNDGGGSLRIPAAACGVFALKVSRGRISTAPEGEGWGGMSTQGVVSRSVRDTAALLDAICSPRVGDPYWRDPPEVSYLASCQKRGRRLRIAFSTASFLGTSLHPACAASVRDAARLCEALGHSVEKWESQAPFQELGPNVVKVISGNVAALLARIGSTRGRAVSQSEVEQGTWFLAEAGKTASAAEYVGALQWLHRFARDFANSLTGYDVLMTATTGSPAVPLGELMRPDDSQLRRIRDWAPNTNIFNVTGQPAASIPFGEFEGLPVGVQIAAPIGEETTLLQLASEIEEEVRWADRKPKLG